MVARVLTLLAALLVAAIGAGLVLAYVGQADSRAEAAVEGREVLVATAPIAAGTTVEEAGPQLKLQKIADSARLDGALETIQPEQLDQIIVTGLQPKQQLVATNVAPDVEDRLGITASGSNAVQVTLPAPNQMAGFLSPGSKVAIYVTYAPAGEETRCTRLLIDEITVISVNGLAAADGDAATPVASAGVVLEVTDANQAKIIRAAAGLGDLYFVLLGGGPATGTGCVAAEDVFP